MFTVCINGDVMSEQSDQLTSEQAFRARHVKVICEVVLTPAAS